MVTGRTGTLAGSLAVADGSGPQLANTYRAP